MNGLMAALIRRNPTLGGVIMANKGEEWFYLEWLAKKHGRDKDIIRLRPASSNEPGSIETPRTSSQIRRIVSAAADERNVSSIAVIPPSR
ncbi:MAG: hypothetical protein ABIZ81_01745, partial [Opitutaceae bacterium]